MASSFNQIFRGAAGTSKDSLKIENVFSTFLYTGNGSTQTITNGIDLSSEGGLVWQKGRSGAYDHQITDTVRGVNKTLTTNDDAAQANRQSVSQFNSNGFLVGSEGDTNANNQTYVSWTFRKAKKFVDIQTWDGNSTARTIAHNLGSVPAMIMIKCTTDSIGWYVYHKNTTVDSTYGNKTLALDTTAGEATTGYFTNTAPTSSVFSLSNNNQINKNGESYVAYIFADNSSEDAADRLITCGGYTGSSNNYHEIDLGYEVQFILIKGLDRTSDWIMLDTMRRQSVGERVSKSNVYNSGGTVNYLEANTSDAEATITSPPYSQSRLAIPYAEGFFIPSGVSGHVNENGEKYIYMAIRRPNMATITDATEVFAMDSDGSALVNGVALTSGFPVDMVFHKELTGTDAGQIASRLQGSGNYLQPSSTAAEASGVTYGTFEHNDGFFSTPVANMAWMWKRAKGYFDVVCYTGTGSAKTEAHSLGIAPDMLWIKNRDAGDSWAVYYGDNTDYLKLDTNAATADNANWWNDTSPTSSVFTVGTDHSVNADGESYIAFIFGTLAGISKVGTVTHSGSSTDVDCGFASGSRFVMLKRTDATGSWYVWDSVRGIIAGNDPYLLMDTYAEQITNTDFIDPLSSGFQISGNFQDGDYMFYAIA